MLPKQVIAKPSWSTKVQNGENATTSKVSKLLNDIQDHNFGIGLLIIEEKWESCYGNLEFDKQKFPNPKEMVYILLYTHNVINDNTFLGNQTFISCNRSLHFTHKKLI